jgi:TonB family protein
MRLVTLLLCSLVAFGQSTAPSPENPQNGASPDYQKNQNQDFGLGVGARGKQEGNVEILSDTKGVDFRPYVKVVLREVRENWYHLIPICAERMKGKLAIEFAIKRDGHVADMRLVATSHAAQLDRSAWGSITASNPFPPLPSEFMGQYLALRFRFYYNPNGSGPDSLGDGCHDNPAVRAYLAASHPETSSGVSVIVTAPLSGNLDVPLGGSKLVTAMVTGTGSKENTVEWRISGLGCSGTSCGEMSKDSYHAPSIMPSTSFVTLTAVAKADPSAKASVTLHVVDSNPSH